MKIILLCARGIDFRQYCNTFIVLLLTLSPMIWCVDPEDKPAPLPPEVQRVVDEHDQAVAKAKRAYDDAVIKADADNLKKMEKIQKTLMRSGDLSGANLAQKQIDTWKPKADGVSIDAVNASDFTGVYSSNGDVYTLSLHVDHTFIFTWQGQSGKYEVKDGRIILNGDASKYFTINADHSLTDYGGSPFVKRYSDHDLFVGTWQIAGLTTLKILKDGTAFWGSTPGTWSKGDKTIKFSWGNEIDIPVSRNCSVVDHGRENIVYQISISK